jgi:lipopolysaccharide export system permease protein
MSKILTRFLSVRYLQSLALVLAAISGIVFATSFMQEIGAMPLGPALDSSFSRFLEMFPMFLPLAAFIGMLMAFYRLTTSSELAVMRSGGMSTYKIMRPMLLVALVSGVLVAGLVNPLSVAYDAGSVKDSMIERVDGAVWMRDKSMVLRARGMAADAGGLILKDATVIVQNAQSQIENRIDAEKLILSDGKLAAENARVLDSKGRERLARWTGATSLSPDAVMRQYLRPNQVSFWRLPGQIRLLSGAGIPHAGHVLQFLSLLLLPLNLAAMAALGAAFAQTKERRRFSFARQFGFGIICCFMVYFVMQIMNAVALSGAVPPVFAMFLPPAIVLFLAMARIAKLEEV